MARLLRIAVLECDEPVGQTKERYGGFGKLFEEWLEASAALLGQSISDKAPELEVSAWDVVKRQEYPALQDVNAVLLSGSRYDSFLPGEDNWIDRLVNFVRAIVQSNTGVRVMGVCFGHQVIGRALYEMPTRGEGGWEVAVTRVELTPKGKQLFGLESLAIHQMHRDMVPSCPSGVEVLGRSPLCAVQIMYTPNLLFSVQGHPEFSGCIANELLDRRRGTVLDDDTYMAGKARAGLSHDGLAVGAAFLRFLLED